MVRVEALVVAGREIKGTELFLGILCGKFIPNIITWGETFASASDANE